MSKHHYDDVPAAPRHRAYTRQRIFVYTCVRPVKHTGDVRTCKKSFAAVDAAVYANKVTCSFPVVHIIRNLYFQLRLCRPLSRKTVSAASAREQSKMPFSSSKISNHWPFKEGGTNIGLSVLLLVH